MKTTHTIISMTLLGLLLTFSNVGQTNTERGDPPEFKMSLIMLHGDKDGEWEWIILLNKSVAFKSIEALKVHLTKQPSGTKLEWDPGCGRIGKEPLLSSKADLEQFKAFCGKQGIEFTILPSG